MATATRQPRNQPPQQQGLTGGQKAALGALALTVPPAVATLAVGATASNAAERASNAAGAVTGALAVISRQRRARVEEYVARTGLPLEGGDVAKALSLENQLEDEFKRRSQARVRAGMKVALSSPDLSVRAAAAQKVLGAEQRYAAQRSEAAAARILSAVERENLRRISPQGALWQLGPREVHCSACQLMAGRVWPWEVLDEFAPPIHYGCGCWLRSFGEALAKGLTLASDLLTPEEARAAASAARALNDDEHGPPPSLTEWAEGLLDAGLADPTELAMVLVEAYDPAEPRDPSGRWTHLAGLARLMGETLKKWDPRAHETIGHMNQTGEETHQVYSNLDQPLPSGEQVGQAVWDADRAKLHEQILHGFMAGSTPAPKKEPPTIMFMAGPPAAGKSSTIKSGDVTVPGGAAISNADEVKKLLPEYRIQTAAGVPEASQNVHEESSYLAKMVAQAQTARGGHVVVDAVGGSSAWMDRLKEARRSGYHVEVNVVDAPLEETLQRARARAMAGPDKGRHVPEEYIRIKHAAVSAQFPEVIKTGVRFRLISTAGGDVRLIAEGNGGHLWVYDQKAYDGFLAKAGRTG